MSPWTPSGPGVCTAVSSNSAICFTRGSGAVGVAEPTLRGAWADLNEYRMNTEKAMGAMGRMQLSRLLIAAVFATAGCASAGGYPSTIGEAGSNISRAKTLIDDATKAGADSLAPDALQSAK